MESDDSELRAEIWQHQTLQEALRDVVARSNTGYSYQELQTVDEEDLGISDRKEEIDDVDQTVNLLGHLFVHYKNNRVAKPTTDDGNDMWDEQKPWTVFKGDYTKQYYDIKLTDGTIISHCYPNAGTFHPEAQKRVDGDLVSHIRVSKKQFEW